MLERTLERKFEAERRLVSVAEDSRSTTRSHGLPSKHRTPNLTPETPSLYVLAEQRIVVTGGGGVPRQVVVAKASGSRLCGGCSRRGAGRTTPPNARRSNVHSTTHRPSLVLHLAAVVGGSARTGNIPGRFFYENAIHGDRVDRAGAGAPVFPSGGAGHDLRLSQIHPGPVPGGSASGTAYPEEGQRPPTGSPRRRCLVQGQAYRAEYGLHSIFRAPRQPLRPRAINSIPPPPWVIPALIRQMRRGRDRGSRFIECWGTGTATREFFTVDDCRRGNSPGSGEIR